MDYGLCEKHHCEIGPNGCPGCAKESLLESRVESKKKQKGGLEEGVHYVKGVFKSAPMKLATDAGDVYEYKSPCNERYILTQVQNWKVGSEKHRKWTLNAHPCEHCHEALKRVSQAERTKFILTVDSIGNQDYGVVHGLPGTALTRITYDRGAVSYQKI